MIAQHDSPTPANRSKGHDINTPLVLTVGLVGVVLVFGVVIPGLIGLYYAVQNRHAERYVHTQADTRLRVHEADQYERITGSPRWINESRGIVGISIDEAMDLYARRHVDRGEGDEIQ